MNKHSFVDALTSAATALESLRRKKVRSALTVFAISVGIGAMIIVGSAGAALEGLVAGQLDAFSPDSLSIEVRAPVAKKNLSGSESIGITVTTLKDADIDTVLKHPNIETAYGTIYGQEIVSYGGQIKKTLLIGRGASGPSIERSTMQSGRYFTDEEDKSLAQVAVLGSKVKERFFGESDPTGAVIFIHGKRFRVVGAMDPVGAAFFMDMDDVVVIPTKTMQKRIMGVSYVPAILAKMKDISRATETVAELTDAIRLNHRITDPARDDFAIHSTLEAQQILSTVTDGITLLLYALVTISLIVGGVGIMNIMYVSVAERAFEIGLRKAIGASSADILRQFLIEAVVLTLLGGGIGVGFGVLVSFAISLLAGALGFVWMFRIPAASVLLSLGFSAAIGLFFGLYPARRAAALNPIDALRKE
jgi:putative ABC transport system permease protein